MGEEFRNKIVDNLIYMMYYIQHSSFVICK